MTTRIFLIDDDAIYRLGVKAALEHDHSVVVVGEAPECGAELPPLLRDVDAVDLVLVGLSESRAAIAQIRSVCASGERSLRQLGRAGRSAPGVLAVSPSGADDVLLAALRAGARGVLLKGSPQDELCRAVHTVAAGGAVFGAGVAFRLTEYLTGHAGAGECPELALLTARERQVLRCIVLGWDNRRIARRLVVAEKTVRNHVTHIFRKIQVTDRISAAMWARDVGVAQEPWPGLTRPLS